MIQPSAPLISRTIKSTSSPHDCLVWIGGEYETVAQFIREAKTRGCCRKMPFWPSWVKRGETRVFLAHRDGHVRTDRGSIFGYFTLGGVGIVFGRDRYDEYSALQKRCRSAPEDRESGESLVRLLREVRSNGLPVAIPDRPPYDDSTLEFALDLLVDCEWEDGSEPSGYGICEDQALLEAARKCGVRQEEGAVYFVDDHARADDRSFCERLKETIEELLEDDATGEERERQRKEAVEKLRSEARAAREAGVWGGIPQFEAALARTHAVGRWWTRVPARSSPIASAPLVLFTEPYPSFKRLPQAAFRGVLRIDGDELLTRIADANESAKPGRSVTVTLPYYHTTPGKTKTKSQVVTDLAEDCQASKAFVSGFLGSVVEEVKKELGARKAVILPGVGTLRVKVIHGSKKVEFTASRSLMP